MLGLVLLYFIGKKFYELAEEYAKNKWGFAILGVVTYYTGALIFGVILGGILLFAESNWLETANRFELALIETPVGILSCYVAYISLEKKWKKETPKTGTMIDEIGHD